MFSTAVACFSAAPKRHDDTEFSRLSARVWGGSRADLEYISNPVRPPILTCLGIKTRVPSIAAACVICILPYAPCIQLENGRRSSIQQVHPRHHLLGTVNICLSLPQPSNGKCRTAHETVGIWPLPRLQSLLRLLIFRQIAGRAEALEVPVAVPCAVLRRWHRLVVHLLRDLAPLLAPRALHPDDWRFIYHCKQHSSKIEQTQLRIRASSVRHCAAEGIEGSHTSLMEIILLE